MSTFASSASVSDFPVMVETLEDNATSVGGFELGNSSMGSVEERIKGLEKTQKAIVGMVSEISKDFRASVDVVRAEIADLSAKLNLTMRAVENQTSAIRYKIKVPEPKPFCGARDTKALENFIFDFEQYFWITNIVAEETKVTLATMYLVDDAKLWWRSKYMDIQDGRCTVDTWESLKQELRSWFLPENVQIIARRKLKELRQTENVHVYVKQFSEIMLDIRNMSDEDKVFYFVEGLKPWLKTKLYEQRVQDLYTAYATAKRLFDLSNDQSQDVRRNQASTGGGNRNYRPNSSKSMEGDRLDAEGRDCEYYQQRDRTLGRIPHNQNNRSQGPSSGFICKGAHRVSECPQRAALHAFQANFGKNLEAEYETKEVETLLVESVEKPYNAKI